VTVVYGSLTTAVIALFSIGIVAMLLLFGAQVIAEYELLYWAVRKEKPTGSASN
jgi:hypothetical protein